MSYLRLDNATRISLLGVSLDEMGLELWLQGTKIVITRIPDIMERNGADRVNGNKVTQYEQELVRASDLPGFILCLFYPIGA